MKRILIIFITVIFSTSILYSDEYSLESFKELYTQMKNKYSSMYPKKFDAYIKGSIVEKQISTIPARSYISEKDNVKLKFTFSQGNKPSIILENVDSFYRDMFSVFEGVLETTGFYVLVGNMTNYDTFSKKFNFESIGENNKEYKVVLRAKGENSNYSVEYTINKISLLIEEAKYYNKKSKIYDVHILYTKLENYILPQKIKYKSSDGRVNSEIEFVNIKIFS